MRPFLEIRVNVHVYVGKDSLRKKRLRPFNGAAEAIVHNVGKDSLRKKRLRLWGGDRPRPKVTCRKGFAEEEAIETCLLLLPAVYVFPRRKGFAEEEAIETVSGDWARP